MPMPKLHLITYGCQMNEYDSERVAGLLKTDQYELCDQPEDADLILLNTCSIREKAEDKVFSQLGALEGPQAGAARPRHRRDGLHGAAPARAHPGARALRGPRVRLARHRAGRASSWRAFGAGERQVLDTGEGALVKITAKPERGAAGSRPSSP